MIMIDPHTGQKDKHPWQRPFQASAVWLRRVYGKLLEEGDEVGMREKKFILVVDDDRRVLNFVGISLRTAGYEVLTSQSGEQALIMMKMVIPDLVILDVLMPGMGGLELLTRLRQFSEIPVILFSIDDSLAGEALKRGATDFINKPVNPHDLIERIDRVLYQRDPK
jgi:DNA-binding response OmpR family regulator